MNAIVKRALVIVAIGAWMVLCGILTMRIGGDNFDPPICGFIFGATIIAFIVAVLIYLIGCIPIWIVTWIIEGPSPYKGER